jgi:redox-sensitive bicupin YhaK (pirin superfamily)
MLLKGKRTPLIRDQGGFVAHINLPGWLFPRPRDHGFGSLAMVVESILMPGRSIAMHEHRNDEIISWVPEGVMRHDDRATGTLLVDRDHLMVMNSGRSFWHSEQTWETDPPLRMLQIVIRPREPDLPPDIQYGPVPAMELNSWRHLAAGEGGDAPFFVRNEVDLFDIRTGPGAVVMFPEIANRRLYFYVFSGMIEVADQTFAEGEQGLLTSPASPHLKAICESVVIAFLVNPTGPVAKQGTIGDHPSIPRPLFARTALTLLRLKQKLSAFRRSLAD